jgi:hypothetical protein
LPIGLTATRIHNEISTVTSDEQVALVAIARSAASKTDFTHQAQLGQGTKDEEEGDHTEGIPPEKITFLEELVQ